MGAERRRFDRVTQPFGARYRRYGDLAGGWRQIKTLNISASGLRFRDDDVLEQMTVLEVEIPLATSVAPLVLRGQVVWREGLASGVNEYGVEFIEMNPEQTLQIDTLVQFLKR
jgi:hypothetical protein